MFNTHIFLTIIGKIDNFSLSEIAKEIFYFFLFFLKLSRLWKVRVVTLYLQKIVIHMEDKNMAKFICFIGGAITGFIGAVVLGSMLDDENSSILSKEQGQKEDLEEVLS